MGRFSAALSIALVLSIGSFGPAAARAQSCNNLQCEQVTSCPAGTTTSITGTVYAPNGTDPLPNVTVYIPNAPVAAFTPGVSCPVVGAPPSGSPLVGTVTNVQGYFELDNVPVGANIPLVIVSGRWRRQIVVPATTACTATALDPTAAVMPQNQSQGDIPRIAIATGAVDQVECVLRKVGISDSEFTDPTGTGRINFFTGSGGPGATISSQTPTQASLMENASTLDNYDVLMLPCQGTPNNNVVGGALGTEELANFVNYANAGGRVYSSHYSYAWMVNNPPFNTVVNWTTSAETDPPNGIATVNMGFTAGQTLSNWLQDVGASTTPGQIAVNTLRVDFNGVNPPTQSWLTLDITGNPVMQFVFNTPIAPAGQTINQCGRVLYNEYHVEGGTSSPADTFPNECSPSATMTPQEKLLEYMLFELTDEGGQPSLAPLTQSFGSQAIGFTSPVETFTWTNNSSFPSQVTSATAGGDYKVVSDNCSAVAPGTSCQIGVTFTPSALGPETGTLTVVSAGNSLTASLTGTGTPGFSLSASAMTFGSLDVGASTKQTLTLTSLATGPLPVPVFTTTGEYAVSTAACGGTLAAMASCAVTVTFLPTTTGQQNGTVGVNSSSLLYNGLNASLSGNGIDFTIALSPASGSVVAGDTSSSIATLTPLAGFAAPLSITCTVAGATASNCGLSASSLTPGSGPACIPASSSSCVTISMNTTSQYTVVGYGGLGGQRYMWLIAVATGWLLWLARRGAGIRAGTLVLMLALAAAVGLSISGCSSKLPAQNAVYTGPGSYVVTVKATDGFLVHSATYSLTVSAK